MTIERLLHFEIRPVPSLPHVLVSDGGQTYRRSREAHQVLIPRTHYLGKHGYHVVGIARNGTGVPHYVHRLTAEAFLPPPKPGQLIRHLDGLKLNNSTKNIRWGTPLENCADTERHGRNPKGVQRYNAKLDDEAVRAIRRMWAEGVKSPVIAQRFGISRSHARDIANRKCWTHI